MRRGTNLLMKHTLWQKEMILLGYKVCNTCYVQMGWEMCGWIHRTAIIGVFIKCLLKDLTINIVKLYLAFWPHQLDLWHCLYLRTIWKWVLILPVSAIRISLPFIPVSELMWVCSPVKRGKRILSDTLCNLCNSDEETWPFSVEIQTFWWYTWAVYKWRAEIYPTSSNFWFQSAVEIHVRSTMSTWGNTIFL